MKRTKSLLPIDEINNFRTEIEKKFESKEVNTKDLIDSVLDILVMAYARGVSAANFDLDANEKVDTDAMTKSIYYKILGVTFEDRIKFWVENDGTVADIMRVVETDSHRVYNNGSFDTAEKILSTMPEGLSIKKTWSTMLDEKVRDSHQFLEGVTIGLDEKFTSVSGFEAYAPGGFDAPEEDCNCRCELVYSIE